MFFDDWRHSKRELLKNTPDNAFPFDELLYIPFFLGDNWPAMPF